MSGERAGHKSLLMFLSWKTCSISRIEISRLRTWLADWVNKHWSYVNTLCSVENIDSPLYSLHLYTHRSIHNENRASTFSLGDHTLILTVNARDVLTNGLVSTRLRSCVSLFKPSSLQDPKPSFDVQCYTDLPIGSIQNCYNVIGPLVSEISILLCNKFWSKAFKIFL